MCQHRFLGSLSFEPIIYDKNKMKATLLLCVILGVIAATAAPTEDAGTKIKEGFVNDLMDKINNQLGGTCIADEQCSFYQSCEAPNCKITNWAWIVMAVVAGLVLLSILSCVCCCVKKIFCCRD